MAKHPTPDPVHAAPRGRWTAIRTARCLIAAITSCTNTSQSERDARRRFAGEEGRGTRLTVNPLVKASLAPGSRVVSDYLNKTGLQPYLDKLGFNLVGYGCTTCIGNSGPLHPRHRGRGRQKRSGRRVVLSGNRNFEARVHQNIKANFLMSPPLVVAFALAGRVDIDLTNDPLGTGKDGKPVYLRDIWPSLREIRDLMQTALQPEVFRKLYKDFAAQNPKWNEIPSSTGNVYEWDRKATYIQEPPFFENFSMQPGSIKPKSRARARWHFWRQRDDRPHFARRFHQENVAGRENISSRTASSRRISTATARAAATTA
jgi:aconitate hydratase